MTETTTPQLYTKDDVEEAIRFYSRNVHRLDSSIKTTLFEQTRDILLTDLINNVPELQHKLILDAFTILLLTHTKSTRTSTAIALAATRFLEAIDKHTTRPQENAIIKWVEGEGHYKDPTNRCSTLYSRYRVISTEYMKELLQSEEIDADQPPPSKYIISSCSNST